MERQLNEQARAIKKDLGIFQDMHFFAGKEQEYPINAKNSKRVHVGRNSPCMCGSGKRAKRCCTVGMYGKKKGKLFRKLKEK